MLELLGTPEPGMAAIHGTTAPGFEQVREAFERNFAERNEIGAAVAVYRRGEKVVDLWGGHRTAERSDPWQEDTLVGVMSATKGMSALTIAVAHSRGLIDYDAPVADYWPEFAQNGKAAITVRQLLGHEAGLVVLDEQLPMARLADLDYVAGVLARQKPAWEPGSRHGYHTISIGLYEQELIRRTDPAGRTLGRFFRDEIAVPLAIDFHIGLPADIPAGRIAEFQSLGPIGTAFGLRKLPAEMLIRAITSGGVPIRSFLIPDLDWNSRTFQEIELPSAGGVGSARSLARTYSAVVEGGADIGIGANTIAELTAPPNVDNPIDEVLGIETAYSLGFVRPSPGFRFGSSDRSFGNPGAGGSFAFADPDARVGFAYVMNRLDFYLNSDPREVALREAVYRAIDRLS